MKIKRWAIYDGIVKEYYYKRFFFRSNAEREVEGIIFYHTMDLLASGCDDPHLTLEEIESIKIVELE